MDEKTTSFEIGSSRWTGFWSLSRVHPLRSMILFAVGAGLGLAIAGYSLFTARGTETHIVPPENIALINQRPILRTDFIAQVEAETGTNFGDATAVQRLKVLDEMIREELFVQRGLELDFPGTDPDTRTALVAAVEQQVVADVTANLPSDAELEKYYLDNREHYESDGQMTLHNFLLPQLTSSNPASIDIGKKAAEAIRVGTDPTELEKLYGLKEQIPDHAGSEQFYFAEKAHLGDTLFTAALSLNDGEVSQPIALEDGVHVLQMVNNIKPVPLSFSQVRSQVLSDYINHAKQHLEDADERYLRGKAEILIANDFREAYQAGLNIESIKQSPGLSKP